MKGKVVTTGELLARWAYAEFNSSRFGDLYLRNLPRAIVEHGKRGDPFGELPPKLWPDLVSALNKVRTPGVVGSVANQAADHFICVHWQPAHLLSCHTLPKYRQMQFFRFLTFPHNFDAAGNPDPTDPRYLSARIPFDPNFRVLEPVIATRFQNHDMLIEGYLRSILWLRNPRQPLAVWVPNH